MDSIRRISPEDAIAGNIRRSQNREEKPHQTLVNKGRQYANAGLGYYSQATYGRSILDYRLNMEDVNLLTSPAANVRFALKTTYPGLLIGSGYPHPKIKERDDDFQIGFYFDYTTGLPVIPGSSIKGVLRGAFRHPELIKELLDDKNLDIDDLDIEIFGQLDSTESVVAGKDVFFDAYLVGTDDSDGRIFVDDYITKHPEFEGSGSLNPVKFLKIRSEVSYCFQMHLKDGIINVESKKELFKKIILFMGVGAKTNVGYGHFEESSEACTPNP